MKVILIFIDMIFNGMIFAAYITFTAMIFTVDIIFTVMIFIADIIFAAGMKFT